MKGQLPTTDRLQEGTKRRALLLFLIIAFVVALVASWWPSHQRRTQIETYLRQGTRQGAALLKRDIDRLSPVGQDPGPAIQHLNALGLSCEAPPEAQGTWACVMRRPGDSRQMISIEATIRVERGFVAESAARITETHR